MSRRFSLPTLLSQVRIDSPCGQDWNTMHGNDQVRFCDHCATRVHDLSEMTAEAAMKLVEQSQGELCVRFIENPDGSPSTKIVPAERLTPGLRLPMPRLAAGVLTAALTLGAGVTKVAAQSSAAIVRADRPVADGQEEPRPRPKMGKIACVPPTRRWIAHDDARARLVEAFEEANPDGDFDEFYGQELFEAVEAEEFDRVQELLAAGFSPNLTNRFGDTPLILAADLYFENDGEIIEKLLKAGADPSQANRFGVTPLMYAVLHDSQTVEMLVNAGANVNAADDNGRTALMYAAFEGKFDDVQTLIRAGADVNARDAEGKTALGYAISRGGAEEDASGNYKRIMKSLRKAGAVE